MRYILQRKTTARPINEEIKHVITFKNEMRYLLPRTTTASLINEQNKHVLTMR